MKRPFALPKLLVVACAFFGGMQSTSLSQDEGSEQAKELRAASIENSRAIVQYDVCGVKAVLVSPVDPSIKTPGIYEEKLEFRLIMDRVGKRCVFLSKLFEEAATPSEKDYTTYRFEAYADGKRIERILYARSDRTEEISFDEFCVKGRVPAIELAGTCSVPFYHDEPLSEYMERAAGNSRGSVKILNDGTRILMSKIVAKASTENAQGAKPVQPTETSCTYHPATLMPVSIKATGAFGLLQREMQYSEVGGIFRLNSMSVTEPRSHLDLQTDTTTRMQATGEVTLKWLRFNEDALPMPDLKKLGRNADHWNKFIHDEWEF